MFKEDGQGINILCIVVAFDAPSSFSPFASLLSPDSPYHFLTPEYAQVTKMLGNGRLRAVCFDGINRLCHIRGKLRKKVSRSFVRP